MKKNIYKIRQGFTLVEMLIVIGFFGVLLVAGTDLFLMVLKNANQAQVENDVRQNASFVMQDMVNEIKTAGSVTVVPNPFPALTQVEVVNQKGTIDYVVNPNGSLTKNGLKLTSEKVVVLNCPCTALTCSTSGLNVSVVNGVYTITIDVRQALGMTRSDFCGKIELMDSVTPRQY